MSTYIKIQNTWTPINKIFKKINGVWVQQNDIVSALGDMIYVYGGNTISQLLYIIGSDEYLGQSFILSSTYDTGIAYPEWSIISGNAYATINANGKVTILSGANENTITVQAAYNGYTETKDIIVTYDGHQLTIDSANTITGTSGNVIARYDGNIITPTWSITSGNSNATIDSSGTITIIQSGDIAVQAEYNDYTTTKNITLVYDAGTTTETEVNEDGTTTTTVTIEVENQDGSTTTTQVVTTTDENGNTSNTESETITNQDGSSTTTSTTTSSDGTSSETTSTTSAPDANGSVTTESTTNTTNADGTTSTTTSELTENEDGSSESSSTTINYDENGNTTGSTTNETTSNVDGSSSSSTTNYAASGDPTDQQNVDTDTSGNINTQDVEYDSNGDPVVTGYSIDTSNNTTTGSESLSGNSGVNTHFIPFDGTNGFELIIKFRTVNTEQPNPPTVTDTEDTSANYHFNILGGKSATAVGGKWPGIDIRWTLAKSNYSGNLLTRYQPASGSQTSLTITNNHQSNVYYLKYVYDPSLSTGKMKIYNLWNSSTTTIGSNNNALGSQNLEITIGYALNMQGNPYRYDNVDILEFNVTKLT